MSIGLILNPSQIPDGSIMDINGKQLYLGNTFSGAIKSVNSPGTSETAFMLLSNPATSGKSLFMFNQNMSVNSAATGATAIFRFYINPTVTTNGTTITPNNNRVNSQSPTSLMKAYSSPTVSANGTFLVDLVTSSQIGTLQSNDFVILDPGNSLLVTLTASAANIPVGMQLTWYEL